MAQTPDREGILLGGVAILMLGLAYASVPLYRIFCQKTGFGGTPQVAVDFPRRLADRVLKIRFNADVNPGLPWTFKTCQKEMTLQVGALGLAFYEVKNRSSKPLWGMATYNVTPEKAGAYFNKVSCFCFEQQQMEAGLHTDLPVQFFIDPAFADDPSMKDVSTITLSYTFFPLKGSVL